VTSARAASAASLAPGRPGGAVWYILGLLFLLALAQAWFMAPAGRQISYSEFKQAVRRARWRKCSSAIRRSAARTSARPTAGAASTRRRIEDPKLIEDLDAANVKYTGELVSRWLPEILGWNRPLLLLFRRLAFFFRRMSGAEAA